ncbi:hypothetical protein BCU88_20460 [Vibrio splendidus]|nr:hypothetical protein BCU88_20460 [Vibrio splendidus]
MRVIEIRRAGRAVARFGYRDAKGLRADTKSENNKVRVVLLAPPLYHDCYLARNIQYKGRLGGVG